MRWWFCGLVNIYLLLTEFEEPYCKLRTKFFSTRVYGPSAKRREHFIQAERPLMIDAREILNVRTIYWFPKKKATWVVKTFVQTLKMFQSFFQETFCTATKQTFEFSGSYSRVRPAKLTNHSTRTERFNIWNDFPRMPVSGSSSMISVTRDNPLPEKSSV